MSAFYELCKAARAAGLNELRFRVDLEKFIDDAPGESKAVGAGIEGSWIAQGTLFTTDDHFTKSLVYEGAGRTGEEALRAVVDRLEKHPP